MKGLVPTFFHRNNDLSRAMLNTSGLVYLCARTMSAAGNLLAVAIFSRLAGPAEYGHYVLIFAWSLIAYGFGAQWMRFAYFGVYQSELSESTNSNASVSMSVRWRVCS